MAILLGCVLVEKEHFMDVPLISHSSFLTCPSGDRVGPGEHHTGLGMKRIGFDTQLCHLLAVWLCTRHLPAWRTGVLCKVEITYAYKHRVVEKRGSG